MELFYLIEKIVLAQTKIIYLGYDIEKGYIRLIQRVIKFSFRFPNTLYFCMSLSMFMVNGSIKTVKRFQRII